MAIFGTGGEEFDDEGADPLRQQEIENLLLWGGARKMRKEERILMCTVSCCPLVTRHTVEVKKKN